MATTTSPTLPYVQPKHITEAPVETGVQIGASVESMVTAHPAVRALLQATGCSVVIDRRGAFVKAYIMDAGRNPVRVRRTQTIDTMTDWLIEALLALPSSPATSYFSIQH